MDFTQKKLENKEPEKALMLYHWDQLSMEYWQERGFCIFGFVLFKFSNFKFPNHKSIYLFVWHVLACSFLSVHFEVRNAIAR